MHSPRIQTWNPQGWLPVIGLVVTALLALPVQGQPLTVDTFEDGDLEARAGLSWVVFSDEQLGGTSQATVEVVQGGAEGSQRALRFSGTLTEEAPRRLAAVWVPVAKHGLPEDLSAYRGIRFHARGDGQTFRAGLRRGLGRLANYTESFTAGKEWTLVELSYDQLSQHAQGATPEDWTPEDISWIGFLVPSDHVGDFKLEIDSVEFYREATQKAADEDAQADQGGDR